LHHRHCDQAGHDELVVGDSVDATDPARQREPEDEDEQRRRDDRREDRLRVDLLKRKISRRAATACRACRRLARRSIRSPVACTIDIATRPGTMNWS
ncbi:hypothetical protein, partial [Streptococcus pneumoniae]|uniref:hypothetical protein n=1 Tax=Streptococcus pneumoniae TaxID=1313 RepID=UPI001CB77446